MKKSEDLSLNLSVNINPYPFKKISFKESAIGNAIEIANKYKNLYVAFSGGMDSEYVVRLFLSLNIPITPIIVLFKNEDETQNAFEVCKKLSINPVVLSPNDNEFIEMFISNIWDTVNGAGINATHTLFAAKYVLDNNGTLLTGEHMINDGEDIIKDNSVIRINAWDFYLDIVYPTLNHIDVFLYSPEIAYAMLENSKEYVGSSWDYFRHKIYNISYRKKFRPYYGLEFELLIKSKLSKKLYKTIDYVEFPLTDLLDKFIIL